MLAGLGVSPADAVRKIADRETPKGKARRGTRKAAPKRGKGTKGGQARHVPTPESRQQASILRGVGLTHEMIAVVLGISVDTLTRHYSAELERGHAQAVATVASALYRNATTNQMLAAQTFWLRHRAGWSDKTVVEHGGKVGLAVEFSEAADAALVAGIEELEAALVGAGWDGESGDPGGGGGAPGVGEGEAP